MFLTLALSLALAADTTTYVVLNHGRPAGEMSLVRDADSLVITYGHIDRNRGRWVQNRYGFDAAGRVVSGESRPMTRQGVVSPASDRYEIVGDSIRTVRGGMTRTAARGTGFFALPNATDWDLALQVRHLLAQPARAATALPGTQLTRLEIAADTVVRTTRGTARVRLAMLHGASATPQAVWVDSQGELVAGSVQWFITVRPEFVAALPAMRAIETAYRDAAAAAIAARIPVAAQGTVVIRNADVFDSERGVIVPRQTIIVQNDRITAMGPAATTRAPRGATVIDATGKTVIPGMWDMHMHFQLTSPTTRLLRDLSTGITTHRDMAADTDVGVSIRDRANAGRIVAPNVVLAGFMEGPTLWAGPSDVLVSTEAQARDWVARYDSLGYKQIKLYNVVHPDLVPTISVEAKKRGMRLSGHIPRGLTLETAIRLGFDEVNHAAFLFSTFYQDSLYWPEMLAYSLVAAGVAKNTDVDGPAMTNLINVMKAHNTVVDGTFNLWMQDTTTADSVGARANNRAYLRLLKRLYDAGVTIVPGTDLSSFNMELELYERAGIPASAVLQMATITSARVMGAERDFGSIAVGKIADLVIINGKPHENIRDARNVHMVMRLGRAYEPKALVDAANTSTFR
jgi:imidazolonepropionase-like amidohydrolase